MRLSERLGEPIKNTPFYSRPLCFISAVFLGALFLIQMSVALFAVYAVAVIAYSVTLFVISRDKSPLSSPLPYLLLIAVIGAMLLAMPRHMEISETESLTGEHTVKGTVTEVYYEEMYSSLYKVKITEIDGEKSSGYAEMTFDYDPVLSVYDTVTAVCDVQGVGAVLTGAELMSARSEDIRILAEVKELVSVTDEARQGLDYRLYTLREGIGMRLDSFLSPNTAAYARALIIGDKTGLGATFKTDMSALGISHILAVSGMHTSIIATLITLFADRIRSSRRLKCLLLIVGGAFFTALVGFTPSVMRAALMMSLGLIAVFFGSRSDPLTSLMLSGVIICVAEPLNAISISFLLSFFATLGITLCALYIQNASGRRLRSSRVGDMRYLYGFIRYFLISLAVTLCATLFTAPVLALQFSEVSYFAIVMNLIAIPMATVSVALTLLVLFFGGAPLIGAALARLFDLLYEAFEGVIHTVARSASTSVSLRYPFFGICLALLLAIFVFMWIARVRSPLAVISALLTVSVLYAGAAQVYSIVGSDRVEAIYLTGENSDTLAVRSGSEGLLIDIGNGSRRIPEMGVREIYESYYETVLDGYMLTHYHTDHIGTFRRMLRLYRIDRIYLPEPETEKDLLILNELIKIAEYTELVMYKRGETLRVGAAEITTLPFCLTERSEHPVIGVNIAVGEMSLVYLGSSVTESAVMPEAERMVSSAETVICGGHGPVTKESAPFITYDPECEVLLSPFEDSDEAVLFRDGRYVYPSIDAVNNIARARIRLS